MTTWLIIAIFIGFITATTASFIGIGGGAVLTPMLLVFFSARGIETPDLMQHIFATNMMFVLVSSSITVNRYRKVYPLKIEKIKWLIAGAVTGALGGGYIAAYLPGMVLKNIFGIVIILSSIRFLLPAREMPDDGVYYLHPSIAFLGGLLAGGIAPLAGIGGGLVFIPILAFSFKFPIKQVPGYSHMAIIITVIISLAGYIWHGLGTTFPDPTLGFVDYPVALAMMIGAPAGIWLGVKFNHHSPPQITKTIVGSFIFILAIYVTFFK